MKMEKKDSLEGEKKGGRRKINIEFIENKSRRHVTFSKRKAGLIKKAYELSTLTGTQVLLLVASETGNVYTFATPKLQPLITKPEGKTLIQACLNPPEVSEISHQQPTTTNLSHQQRMPPDSHIYPEKKAPSSNYQTKDGLQNMWTPLQERIMKDPKVVTTPGGLSELGNFSSYGGTNANNSSMVSPPTYSQYNYGSSMYGMNTIPRYQSYPNSTGNYNQFGPSTHQIQQQNNQYAPNSSYMYPPPVGTSSPTPFTSNNAIEGSTLSNKDPIV